MTVHHPLLRLLVLLGALLTAGCGSTPGGPDGADSGPSVRKVTGLHDCQVREEGYYYLGAVLAYSGALSVYGPRVEDALLLALVEINGAGGIGGRSVGLVRCDSNTSPARAADSFEELARASPAVTAIVGPMASSEVLAAAPVAKEHKQILISPSATSPAISTLDDGDLVFRTIVSDAAQGRVAAAIAAREGYQSAFTIYRDDAYGQGLAGAFEKNFTAGGGTVTGASYSDGSSGFAAAAIAKARQASPDVVFLVGFLDDGAAVVKQAAADGFAPKWIFAEALKDKKFVDAVGNPAHLEGALGTAPAPATGATYTAFSNAYRTVWAANPGLYDPHGYDAAYLLATAMQLSGTPESSLAVRDALRRTSDGAAFGPGDWAKALEAERGGKLDYQGASGPVDLDAKGDVLANIREWTIKNGSLTDVGCWDPDGKTCK